MKRRSVLIPLILFFLFLFVGQALAQGGPVSHFEINAIDPAAWPQVVVYGTALDDQNNLIPPEALQVQVFEDNKPVPQPPQVDLQRTGLAVVILMDLSGSMNEPGVYSPTRFSDAQSAALEFINNKLVDGDLVGVVGFGSEVYDEDVLLLTYDRAQAAALIQNMTPYTDREKFNTALWDAGFRAMRMFAEHPDAPTREAIARMRRSVVAFTDGNDTASEGTRPGDLAIWARELGVAFNTVGLKSPPGVRVKYKAEDEDAKWLAEQTLGEFFDFGDPAQRSEFPIFLDRLAAQRDQLRISYTSTAKAGPDVTRVVVSSGQTSQEDEIEWAGGGKSIAARLVQPTPSSIYTCDMTSKIVNVRAEVISQDGAAHVIDKVEFSKDGQSLGQVQQPPYETTWDISNEKPGEHKLMAVMHDATLNEIIETPVIAVSVQPPMPAEVRLIRPTAGATLLLDAGSTLPMKAQVTFPDGCVRPLTVRFKLDGDLIPGAEKTSPPYEYTLPLDELSPGAHQASVEYVDSAYPAAQSTPPVSFQLELTQTQKIIHWLRSNWPLLLLALVVLLLLLLLLRTRRQIGKAVGQAAVRVRQTLMGAPSAEARGVLSVVRGPSAGSSFRLVQKINTIGRDPARSDIVIRNDGYISGVHCRIDFDDQGNAAIMDVGSTHGTQVNGAHIPPNQPVQLQNGDRIRIGESELEFKLSRKGTRIVQRG